ncbi:hypothetical protein [Sphingomonas sp. SUN039]|uniref:hypothetical protein n=1 Tax=Sphingomonas sp. SUN039 TaxID=2937787 RepID=UPI0021643DF8|nr:hypothetical protein [Sphingomonas sp. SUN039]UVO53417.1 hypothetical protein M0209_04505 [Sphingomonas sp. SUN039]
MKIAAVLPFILISACAGVVDAPSLLPRTAENADIDAPAPPPVRPVATDAGQAALIVRLIDQAKQSNVAFERALPAASTNAPPQSEAWIAAQNARSAVDVARGPTLDALSALDVAIGEAIDKGQDTTALTAARTEVQAIYDRQGAKLDALIR